MEEREQEWEKELQRNWTTDHDAGNNGGTRGNDDSAARTGEAEAMDIDGSAAPELNASSDRLEAFSGALGRYKHAQHVDKLTVDEIETVVNNGASVPYSRADIMSLLQMMEADNKLYLVKDTNVVYFV